MFKLDETIMVLSKSDREAIAAGEIVKRGLIELPSWMRPDMDKNNDHQKLFNETGCKLFSIHQRPLVVALLHILFWTKQLLFLRWRSIGRPCFPP